MQQAGASAQPTQMGPVKTNQYHVTFVRLGSSRVNGLLYEPEKLGPNARVALVYSSSHPSPFDVPATEMASRGYRVLFVQHYVVDRRTEIESPLNGFDETSRAITYLRTQPGVQRVVLIGWGTNVTMVSLYADVAEHGPAACQRSEVLTPCETERATGLAKPDGVVMFDPEFGALTTPINIDPSYVGDSRTRKDLDIYSTANGYDPKTGGATYSEQFRKQFFTAQMVRNNQILDNALARVKLLDQGKGTFTDDEPMVVPGAVNVRSRTSLHRTDITLLSHTKQPHTLLKADGSKPTVIVQSLRPATGVDDVRRVGQCCEAINYTIRRFLANNAVRTTQGFALTDDDILGVDWKSSNALPPASAEGITVPTLVVAQTCDEFVVPSEVTYDHLAARDKTFVAVEGGSHFFTQCKPEFGDTKERTFDFVDEWLRKPGRF
jgi:hypothetical protein